MSSKNRDEHNRWRNKTVAFRVSPEDDVQIERYVQLSGLTKQDYITRRLTHKDVVVQGNPRVFKALRIQLADVLSELQRIEAGSAVNDELLDLIEMIVAGSFWSSVVARMNTTCAGGSSSVLSNALNAEIDSMCTSSTMYTRYFSPDGV